MDACEALAVRNPEELKSSMDAVVSPLDGDTMFSLHCKLNNG